MSRSRTTCLTCGRVTTSGSRCETHSQQRRSPTGRATGRLLLKLHRMQWGNVCPGWERAPHVTPQLQIDHCVPLSRSGLDVAENMQVLCSDCNRDKGELVGYSSMTDETSAD